MNGKVHLDVMVMKLCAVGLSCINQNCIEINVAASTRNRTVDVCLQNCSKCRATSLNVVKINQRLQV